MGEEKTVTIKLTKEELWELMNNFDASFDDGIDENTIASRVSEKLAEAHKRMQPA